MPNVSAAMATVSYCRLNQNANQSSGQQHQPIEYTAGADIKKLAEYSASVYAQTPEEHASYVEYYTMYYQQQQAQISSGTQSDSVNAAAAVAQSALQAMQQKVSGNSAVAATASISQANYSTTLTSVSSTTADTTSTSAVSTSANYDGIQCEDLTEYPKYPPPDVSTYTYDEASGYYYDPSTGLFYDAASTYYYNSETGQYLYWDAERSTYMPSPSTDDMQDGPNAGLKDKKEKQEKQDKVKVAKKIAKDMERWAKAQNKRNETVSKPLTEPVGGNVGEGLAGSGAADAAFAVLLERRERTTAVDKPSFQMHMNAPLIVNNLKKSGLVAAYGGEGSDSEEEKEVPESSEKQEEKIVDLVKMACLLCKRQFPNRDMLNKHVQLSNLHKSNLDAFRKQAKEAAAIVQAQYRDRAKERRDKYGQPNGPPPNKLKERYMAAREEVEATATEEVSRDTLGDNSVASKLMKKMGWSDGMGLGKSNQGRTKIIEAERRVSTAGLGMQGANYSVAGDSYKDCVKKMMLHRYQELDAIEKSTGKR